MSYIRTDEPARPAQLLQVCVSGQQYDFVLEHAEEERFPKYFESVGRVVLGEGEAGHNVYHIVLYTSGKNEFMLCGRRCPSYRGVLALTSPGEGHNFGTRLAAEIGSCFSKELTFVLENKTSTLLLPINEIFSYYSGIDLPPITFPQVLNEQQTAALERLFDLLLMNRTRQHQLHWFTEQRAMYDIIMFIIDEVYLPQCDQPATEDDVLFDVKKYIEQHYMEKLSLTSIAQQAFLSVGYLSRIFTERFGIPPIAFLQEVRLRTAQTLLRSSSRPISEIALQVGFSNIYYFSRTFKLRTGYSPSDYRRKKATAINKISLIAG